MGTHNIQAKLRDGEFPNTWRGIPTPNGVMLALGIADPTDEGYAPGCLLLNNSDATVKRNSGTAAAATWTAVGAAAGVATGIADGATLNDAGGNDAVLAHTTQTVSAPTLTVPDFGGVNDTYAFITLAQTLLNKTLTAPTITGATLTIDSPGAFNMGIACGNTLAAADRILTLTLDSDAAHALTTPEGLTTAILAGYAGVAARGEILFFNAAGAWERLGVGTSGQGLVSGGAAADVYWGAPALATATNLANTVTCEAGGTDYTLDFGTSGGAYTLTIPAVAASRTFAFIDEAQVFTAAQSFDSGTFLLSDDDQSHYLTINWEESEAGAARALDLVMNGADRIINLTGDLVLGANLTTNTGAITLSPPAAGATVTLVGNLSTAGGAFALTLTMSAGTNVTLPTTGTLAALGGTNIWTAAQTFGKADIQIMDGDESNVTILTNGSALTGDRILTLTHKDAATALTFANDFITAGDFSLTLTTTAGTDVTLPVTGTLATLAGAETLTNKTVSADGAGNAFTNWNADELDSVAPGIGIYGVPFLYVQDITDVALAGENIETNAPFKFRVIDAWSQETSANGGTWTLHKGSIGAVGNAITDTVTATGDTDVVHCGEIITAERDIAGSGSMVLIGDAGGALDITIYILCVRVD